MRGGSLGRRLSEGLDINRGAELLAGSGDNNSLVVVIGAEIGERVADLGVKQAGKLQRVAFGMDGQLNDAVAPVQLDVLVLVLVIVEFDQRVAQRLPWNSPPCGKLA